LKQTIFKMFIRVANSFPHEYAPFRKNNNNNNSINVWSTTGRPAWQS